MTEKLPFALAFTVPIEDKEIFDATGRYDLTSQTWILSAIAQNSSKLVMSWPNSETPPTVSEKMTKMSEKLWITDKVVDD